MHHTRPSQAFRSRGWLLTAAALVGGCAIATGAPEEATIVPGPGTTALDPTPLATGPDLLATTPRASADPDAFAVGVGRAAIGELAFAIPAFSVQDGTALYLTVRTIVGAVSGVGPENVLAEDTRCDQRDPVSCAFQFERIVASHNGALSAALAPYSRVVSGFATDVQVVSWTPVRDGSPRAPVTTIQGIRDGRLLGIVVLRELPATSTTGAP